MPECVLLRANHTRGFLENRVGGARKLIPNLAVRQKYFRAAVKELPQVIWRDNYRCSCPVIPAVRRFWQTPVAIVSRHQNPSSQLPQDFSEIEPAPRLLTFEAMSQIVSRIPPDSSPKQFSSAQSLRTLRLGGELSCAEEFTAQTPSAQRWRRELLDVLADGIKRRWAREQRRRKVGRAYDMALEIARMIPRGSEALDVGCGNGFIAHHLSAMLGTSVIGIDVTDATVAPIDFRSFDGRRFPLEDNSVDAVLLCYVLHHAQDVHSILNEVRRVLREGGQVVIYEDIPATSWDRIVCEIHNRKWRDRTGPCTFRNESEWQQLFISLGFEIVSERRLSRARNFTHPISRRFFCLRLA